MTDTAIDVAHVTTVHPSTDNRIFRKECTALQQAGLAVALVAVAANDETVSGVRLVALPSRPGRLRRMVLGPIDAWRALSILRPAMIHVHDPELIPLAILWRVVRRRPAVFDAHEDLAKQITGKTYIPRLLRAPIAWLARRLEATADNYMTAVVAATPAIARNFHRAPVTLVQNFPWLRDFPTPAIPKAILPLTLSYVGMISRERSCLEMMAAVQKSTHLPRLVLAGPATSEMIRALNADTCGRIDYRGVLPVDDVPRIIADSHAGLVLFHPLPNHVESQPTKLFEYMASGRPFIASDFPFWKNLLADFDCGIFIDPTDVGSLTQIIEWLEQHPEEATAMGIRGRQALVTNFTFEIESQRLIEMTSRLLGHQGATSWDSPANLDRSTTGPLL